ncbi:MAG: hypothetical protein JWO03_1621 [Bacteroidetes bacterium]|nr:hypothetical protein [Bacteroidota bacterium]
MKNVLSFFLIVFFSVAAFAQVPQGISYQAIAFNATGGPVTSANVGVRVSILSGSATGPSVYVETHTKTTNAQGLFNLVIGQGTVVSGTFAGIDWAASSKFLKVEIDPAGGTSYTSVGSNQLMSVPFALSAASVVNSGNNTVLDQLIDSRSTNIAFRDNYDSKVYAYSTALGAWSSQTYNSSASPTVTGTKGNFYFRDNYDSKFYVFNSKSGVWSSQTYNSSASPTPITDTLSGDYAFVDNYAYMVYVYAVKTGTWSSQSYNPSTSVTLISSKGNFAFRDNYDYKVYAFSGSSGTWSSQSYNPSASPTVNTSNGSFYFRDNYDSKVYMFNSRTAVWTSQTYNPSASPTIIISEVE